MTHQRAYSLNSALHESAKHMKIYFSCLGDRNVALQRARIQLASRLGGFSMDRMNYFSPITNLL